MSELTSRLLLPIILAAVLLGGCGTEEGGAMNPLDPGCDVPEQPSVTVVFPNGGELLEGRIRIEWTADDPDPGDTELLAVVVEFSSDSGVSWREIFNRGGNTGGLDWDLGLMEAGDEYLVRVTAVDTSGLSAFDTSDSTFSVAGGIFIEDATGLRWNITHAVEVYGMAAKNWRYGLGPDAILPVNDPQFLSPGDPDYPSANLMTQVIGVEIGGDARAYPISAISRHEVVNDRFGDEALAVIY